jgi:hypothetical protein
MGDDSSSQTCAIRLASLFLSLSVVQSATRPKLVIQYSTFVIPALPASFEEFRRCSARGMSKVGSLLQNPNIHTFSTARVLGNTCVY